MPRRCKAEPELCSLNMGSMNFGIFHAGAKIKDWKYDWEKPYVEKTRESIVSNTFAQIERFIERLGQGCGTRFECECYDVGHLYTLAHYPRPQAAGAAALRADHLRHPGRHRRASRRSHAYAPHRRPPVRQRLPMVDPGGRPPPDDALPPSARAWAAMSASAWRTASIWGPDTLAKSNAEQVGKIKRILAELSLEIATPEEARAMLKLKGGDRVAF